MNDREQLIAFAVDLDNLIERYIQEFNLPFAGIVGLLHIKAHAITQNQLEQDEDI